MVIFEQIIDYIDHFELFINDIIKMVSNKIFENKFYFST